MKLGIIGGGVVGSATARAFLEHVEEVRVYDKVKERRTHDMAETLSCDIVMVCLPTPQVKDGLACDTSYVENFFAEVSSYYAETNFVLRSTVPVGFTRKMVEKMGLRNLVHSPEFLTARCAMVDAQIPSRNVIGYPGWNFKSGGTVEDYLKDFTQDYERGLVALLKLYSQRWPHVPIFVMKSDTSEGLKLIQNSFFAVKVSFFNEVHAFCKAKGMGSEWEQILSALLADGRIHPSHTQVPGPDGSFGFGGTCLPKDLASLINLLHEAKQHQILDSKQAREVGYGSLNSLVCEAAYERNKLDRMKSHGS